MIWSDKVIITTTPYSHNLSSSPANLFISTYNGSVSLTLSNASDGQLVAIINLNAASSLSYVITLNNVIQHNAGANMYHHIDKTLAAYNSSLEITQHAECGIFIYSSDAVGWIRVTGDMY